MLFIFSKYQANINIFGIFYFVVNFGIDCWLIVTIRASELYQALVQSLSSFERGDPQMNFSLPEFYKQGRGQKSEGKKY